MNIGFILPVFLGLTVVSQGVLNRRVGAEWGLSSAVLLNAAVFFMLSTALIIAAKYYPEFFPEQFRLQSIDLDKIKPWFLVPGICGFMLVMGVPWSLQMNGPSKTFIFLIVSQVVFSLVFEKLFFSAEVGWMKVLGAILAVAGAGLVALG